MRPLVMGVAAVFSLVLAAQAAGSLDPAGRYYVKIDNTGDGVEDVAYRWP